MQSYKWSLERVAGRTILHNWGVEGKEVVPDITSPQRQIYHK